MTLLNNDPAPEPTPTPDPTPDPTPGDPPAWLQGVEEDFVNDPIMKDIADVPTLVKSYVNAQRMVGKDKVVLPDSNASEEDWTALFGKLGRPDEATYEANHDNIQEDFTKEFYAMAHKANMLPSQVKQVMDFYSGKITAQDELNDSTAKETVENAITGLKEDWGEGFDRNVHRAQSVIKLFDGEENKFKEYLDESGLGNDPQLIRFLAKVGESLKEDTFQPSIVNNFGLSAEDAQRKINEVMGNFDHPYHKAEHIGHNQAVADMKKLFESVS